MEAITLTAGEEEGSSLSTFITKGKQKSTQIFSDNQDITEDLKNEAKWHVEEAGELQEILKIYGEGATVKCHGWYDQYGYFWSLEPDSEQKLADRKLLGKTIELYAVYSIVVPENSSMDEFAGKTIECAIFDLIVDEYDADGNFLKYERYYINVPSGCQLEYTETDRYAFSWKAGTVLEGKTITMKPGMNTYTLNVKYR